MTLTCHEKYFLRIQAKKRNATRKIIIFDFKRKNNRSKPKNKNTNFIKEL
jgi:hypothetical protein